MKRLWHIFLGILNLLLAICMLVSSFGGTVSPDVSVVPALMAMLLPFFLPLMLVALVVSCFISWKAMVFNLVVLLCCSSSILNICPLNFDADERLKEAPASSRFSIMTYNVMELNYLNSHGEAEWGNRTPTVEYLASSGCDIIAYQEAYNLGGKEYPGVSAEALSKLHEEYPYVARSSSGYLGLLSKFPARYIGANIGDTPSFFADCYEVDIRGVTVTIVNVHMQSIGLSGEDKELYHELTSGEKVSVETVKQTLLHKLKDAFKARARQAIKVRHLINDLHGPVILCGDFNDIPGCYAMRAVMGNDLRDAYRDAGLGPAITYHANRFYFRIDQILYRGLTPLKVRVWTHGPSDHYPVVAQFSTINN